MSTRSRQACYAAALIAPSFLLSAPAGAQSLALTYKLSHSNTDTARQAAIGANRCAGLNWVASIGACGRDLLSRLSGTSQSDSEGAAKATSVVAPDSPANAVSPGAAVTPPREKTVEGTTTVEVAGLPDLPTLGSPDPEPRLRSAGGKDALIGNARTVDLMFRFGSKYRLRSADEGWEWYRFTDTGYDNRPLTNNKALAVELLFPFQ